MDRRRQAIFLFVAAAAFGLFFVERVARHGFGGRALVAGIVAAVLVSLAVSTGRRGTEDRGDREP